MIPLDTTVDLGRDYIQLRPLLPTDFEAMFTIAADPLLWEQHPQSDRYKREVFETYFALAIEQGTAYVIVDTSITRLSAPRAATNPPPMGPMCILARPFFPVRFGGRGLRQ